MAASSVLLNPKAPEFQMPTSFNPNAPEFKPYQVDSALTLRPEAAEFIPMHGGWAAVQAASEAYQNKQKRQMPWASDEEWEQRISKREKEVATIKSLQSYRLYIEVFPHDKRNEDDPKTPDPRDRTVSKRMWKWNVEKWRLQLKSRCVYSRAVLLQFREELRRQHSLPAVDDTFEETPSDEPMMVTPSSGAGLTSGISPAGRSDTAIAAKLAPDSAERYPLHAFSLYPLKTLSIPEGPVTIPSGGRRATGSGREAGYRGNNAAATPGFQ